MPVIERTAQLDPGTREQNLLAYKEIRERVADAQHLSVHGAPERSVAKHRARGKLPLANASMLFSTCSPRSSRSDNWPDSRCTTSNSRRLVWSRA